MNRTVMTNAKTLLGSRLAWLPLAVLLTFSVALPLGAQEPPPSQEDGTRLRLSALEQIVPVGEELIVEALVEDVEHLAGFTYTVGFDSEQIRFVRVEESETFLASGERKAVICEEPAVSEDAVMLSCVALESPVCAGGPAGVSGDGLLGRLVFEADAPSFNDLSLTESRLILDDVEPCEEADELVNEIPHSTEDASILFAVPSHEVQETPALIRLEAPDQQVDVGDEFEVRVLVDDVEHLGSFDFAVAYDPERVSFVAIRDAGAILTDDERRDIICVDPLDEEGTALISCVARDAPACMGGLGGVSGSGLLGRVVFRATSAGTAAMTLTIPTDLVLDDVQPCDPADGQAVIIPHETQGADVEIAGSDDIPWLLVGLIAAAALVVVGGGAAWLLLGRRGSAQTSEE